MHIIFIAYGKKEEVEILLRDMSAQKHKIVMTKGKKKKKIWIEGQVRYLPFGVMEYICPEPDGDCVMNTLRFKEDRYKLGKMKLGVLRKLINCEKIPKYKEDNRYLWIKQFVTIIPLGVRYDTHDMIDQNGPYKGWKHEAI